MWIVSSREMGIPMWLKLDVIKFLAELGPMNLMDCFKKHFNRCILLAAWGVKVIGTILLLPLKKEMCYPWKLVIV